MLRGKAPKTIAQVLSFKYGYVRRCLADLRKTFGVHSSRELLLIFETCDLADTSPIKLSPRGGEVLRLFMRGLTYEQIGEALGMSASGVRRHREKMLWENDCGSVLELIAKYRSSQSMGISDDE